MAARILDAAEQLARFGLNARGIRSRWVETDAARMHVYDGKGGGTLPVTVMLHGLSAAGASFARVVARLRPHVKRIIMPELPGHGFSPHPGDRPLTPELLLDTMTVALDRLLDEPAIVYGNSLGGAVALEYALRRPDKVRGLVLVSPAGARLPEEEWKRIAGAFAISDARDARRFFERIYHRPPWFLALVAHEFPDIVNRRAVRDLLSTSGPEHAPNPDALASLRMPVLLVWGRSERLLPVEALEYFRRHLPRHTVIEQPDAFGHAPQTEHPARVAERVVSFARALGADVRS